MIPAAVRAADIGGLQPDRLSPPQPGEGHQQDPDELGLAAKEPAALGEQQCCSLGGPYLLRRAPGPVLAGLAAAAALAAGRIHVEVPGGDGVGQDRMQAAPGAADVLDGVAAFIDERAFPAVDLLARERPDRAIAEGRQDELPDRRGVVGPGGEFDVPGRPDLADPLGQRDLALCGGGLAGGVGLDGGASVAGGLQGLVPGRVAAGRPQLPVGVGVAAAPGGAALLGEALGPGHHGAWSTHRTWSPWSVPGQPSSTANPSNVLARRPSRKPREDLDPQVLTIAPLNG